MVSTSDATLHVFYVELLSSGFDIESSFMFLFFFNYCLCEELLASRQLAVYEMWGVNEMVWVSSTSKILLYFL